jgi:hypothetical protein
MEKIEEFKSFVRTKPELISYVKNGTMTWQKFYELWVLYGPDHEEWNKYKNVEQKNTSKQEALVGLTDIFNMLKKVDLDAVRTNINGVQKAIGLIQEITSKGDSPKVDLKEPYNPRPMYRRFED